MRGVVQHVGIEVNAVWPNDGAGFRIYGDLGEEAWVLKRSEHAAAASDPGAEIDRARRPIRELEGDLERSSGADSEDAWSHSLL